MARPCCQGIMLPLVQGIMPWQQGLPCHNNGEAPQLYSWDWDELRCIQINGHCSIPAKHPPLQGNYAKPPCTRMEWEIALGEVLQITLQISAKIVTVRWGLQIDEYVVRALNVSDSFLVSAYVLGLLMNKLAEWFVLGVHAGRWHFARCRWCALFWTGLQCSSDNRLRYE